jgi:hypothetical protein
LDGKSTKQKLKFAQNRLKIVAKCARRGEFCSVKPLSADFLPLEETHMKMNR